MSKKHFTERAEEALNSVDRMERADAGPWFYTRVMNRLHQRPEAVWEKIGASLTRPAILLATLFFILFINGFFLLKQPTDNTIISAMQENTSFADSESLMASNSSFDYENFVQP